MSPLLELMASYDKHSQHRGVRRRVDATRCVRGRRLAVAIFVDCGDWVVSAKVGGHQIVSTRATLLQEAVSRVVDRLFSDHLGALYFADLKNLVEELSEHALLRAYGLQIIQDLAIALGKPSPNY